MSEIRRSEIIYEEGWRENGRQVSVPASSAADRSDDGGSSGDVPPPEEKTSGSRPLLISIQLAICLLFVLALFLLKSMDSEIYRSFIEYYRDELEKPLVSQGVFDAADVSRILGADAPDQASPDEVPDS